MPPPQLIPTIHRAGNFSSTHSSSWTSTSIQLLFSSWNSRRPTDWVVPPPPGLVARWLPVVSLIKTHATTLSPLPSSCPCPLAWLILYEEKNHIRQLIWCVVEDFVRRINCDWLRDDGGGQGGKTCWWLIEHVFSQHWLIGDWRGPGKRRYKKRWINYGFGHTSHKKWKGATGRRLVELFLCNFVISCNNCSICQASPYSMLTWIDQSRGIINYN